jgi:hypothetical protein
MNRAGGIGNRVGRAFPKLVAAQKNLWVRLKKFRLREPEAGMSRRRAAGAMGPAARMKRPPSVA